MRPIGEAKLADRSHRVAVEIEALAPDAILTDLGIPDTGLGPVEGMVRAAGGSLEDSGLFASLRTEVRGIPVGIELAGAYREGRVDVTRARISSREAELSGLTHARKSSIVWPFDAASIPTARNKRPHVAHLSRTRSSEPTRCR